MVAAWINADTGVGPAIASGNHVYNGICALLPMAPTNNKVVMAVISKELSLETWQIHRYTMLCQDGAITQNTASRNQDRRYGS